MSAGPSVQRDGFGCCCGACDCDSCGNKGPCSICGLMFVDCKCTPEQITQAWRGWFKENVDPEKVKSILGHDE